jgi:hypothetical protein
MKTITIDLGDGDCAELYEQLRHGTARRIQEVYQPYHDLPDYKAAMGLPTVKERVTRLTQIISQVDMIRAGDVLILGQIKEWTLGEISQATLDDMPEKQHEKLIREANKLYEPPLPESKAGD